MDKALLPTKKNLFIVLFILFTFFSSQNTEEMSSFSFLFPYFRKHSPSYLAGIFFLFLTNWIAVSIPKFVQEAIDLILIDDSSLTQNSLQDYIFFILLSAFGLVLVRTFSRILFFNPGRSIEKEIKNDLFQTLMKQEKNYFDQNSTGSIISRINNDINGVRLICGFGMLQVFNLIFAFSLTPYKMWELSPRLTLFCIIPVIIIFSLTQLSMKYFVKLTAQRMKKLQDFSGYTVASLSGTDVIRSYNMGKWAQDKFQSKNLGLLELILRISWIRSFFLPIFRNMDTILILLVLFFGGKMVIQSQFTIGEFTAFLAYTGLITLPLGGMAWLITLFQQGLVGLRSLQTIFSSEFTSETKEALPTQEKIHLFDQGIEVKDLSYTYPSSKEPALKKISFSIQPGEKIGILGEVGSGKTTLVNCLNGYLKAPRGTFQIGNKDSNDLASEDLHYVVRTLSEEPFLLSDTVKNNIVFGFQGKEKPSKAEIHQAIENAALKKEVENFPKKEETLVGEKGIMLSGGQKQRICLARAMLNSCDLLVLDNAFSAVDYDTERFLAKQWIRHEKAKSLLIVTHRVHLLEKLDKIFVLQKGQITEQGTHQELLKKSPFYRKTWKLQYQS